MGNSIEVQKFERTELYKILSSIEDIGDKAHYVVCSETLIKFFNIEGEYCYYLHEEYKGYHPMWEYCRMVELVYDIENVYDQVINCIDVIKRKDINIVTIAVDIKVQIKLDQKDRGAYV